MSARTAFTGPRLLAWSVAWLAVGVAVAFGASFALHRKHAVSSAGGDTVAVNDLGPAPSLTGFTDQQGRPFDPEALRGKLQVVSFLDPVGDHASPVIAVNVLRAVEADLQATGQFGSKVVFVSLNADPQRAGPSQMATFMRKVVGFGKAPAPAGTWPFLTASPGRIDTVARKGYGVNIQQLSGHALRSYVSHQKADGTYFYARTRNPLAQPGGATVVGNGTIVIVGPKGRLRARIPRAYARSSVAIEHTIDDVLNATAH